MYIVPNGNELVMKIFTVINSLLVDQLMINKILRGS